MPHVDYFIKVDPDILREFSYDNPTGNNKRVGGVYYKFRKSRWSEVDEVRMTYAEDLYDRVMEMINDACDDLINFWYRSIPEYFYRTEQGQYGSMLKSGDYLGAAVKDLKRKAKKYGGHSTSGRLRDALFIYDIDMFGASLAIKELPSTSTGDYVAILKSGAGPNDYAPYDPKRNIRLVNKPGRWGGFPHTYWTKWDTAFRRELLVTENSLNNRIQDLVDDYKRRARNDMAKVRRNTSRYEEINVTNKDRFQRDREKRSVNKVRRR